MGKYQMKTGNIVFVISLLLGSGVMAQQAVHPPESSQGGFFAKKEYAPCPLPKFDDLRGQLPSPIFDEKPENRCYRIEYENQRIIPQYKDNPRRHKP